MMKNLDKANKENFGFLKKDQKKLDLTLIPRLEEVREKFESLRDKIFSEQKEINRLSFAQDEGNWANMSFMFYGTTFSDIQRNVDIDDESERPSYALLS